jgi:tRNA-(ms[2]io[6]A)-hydroxylase
MTDISHLIEFLPCRTPDVWVEQALSQQKTLLIDHAMNEMKAAQSAMTLIARNPTKLDLLNKMSRLAREELRHFEQVLAILKKRKISYQPFKPCRYAGLMVKHVRKEQVPALVDTLIVGGIIEARSCERFDKLAPHLDETLGKFYYSLLKSEARHYEDYLSLARANSPEPIDERVAFFLDLERDAILSEDRVFRFHSGIPA